MGYLLRLTNKEKTMDEKSLTTRSVEIGKLALALSQAQGEITGANKDSVNPFFKSKYADLASCWDACRQPLSKNKLAVIQTTEPAENGVNIITTLIHESGQWIGGKLFVKPVKNDPQGLGSALTYGRRYALSAIVGLAQVDDDGNAATHQKPEKNHQQAKQKMTAADFIEMIEAANDEAGLTKIYKANESEINQLSETEKNKVIGHCRDTKIMYQEQGKTDKFKSDL